MNWLDYAIIIIVALFAIRGFKKGLLGRILSLVGAIVGIIVGVRYNSVFAKLLVEFGVPEKISPYLAVFVLFVASIIIANVIAQLVKDVFVVVGLLDKIAGGVFGVIEGAVILGIIFMFLSALNFPSKETRQNSKLYNTVKGSIYFVYDTFAKLTDSAELKKQIEKTLHSLTDAGKKLK